MELLNLDIASIHMVYLLNTTVGTTLFYRLVIPSAKLRSKASCADIGANKEYCQQPDVKSNMIFPVWMFFSPLLANACGEATRSVLSQTEARQNERVERWRVERY